MKIRRQEDICRGNANYSSGEPVKSARIREAEEECGVWIGIHDLEVVGAMHRRADAERIDFFLTASRWSGDIWNAKT